MRALAPALLGALLLAPPAAAQTVDQLAGKWGVSAYWAEKDAKPARGWARAACGHPYVIGKTAAGNLTLYLADEVGLKEVKLTSGFGAPALVPVEDVPGGRERHTRTVAAFEGTSFELHWKDATVAQRYGRMVFVRCGK